MRSAVIALLLFLGAGPSWAAGTVRHYDIDVALAASQGRLHATATLTVVAPAGGLTQVELLLNHALDVRSVGCDAGVKGFRFDRSEKSLFRYTPTAAPLRIDLEKPVPAGEETQVRLEYEGKVEADSWKTSVLTPEWVELAMYAAWYPYDPESRAFSYRLDVSAEPDYAVAGPGTLARSGERWTVIHEAPTWDIVLVAARGLTVRRVDAGGLAVDVWHVRSRIGDEKIDPFARDVSRMMNDFRGWYGTIPAGRLTIVFAERASGGGYYRPGFISLLLDDDYRGLVKYAAHEVAHFWWGRGPATTWEDWLNESFAEYSSLLLMRSWYGADSFDKTMADYEGQAATTPAIWGLDRNDPAAFPTLYRRGPVLLHRLEQRIGEEPYRRFAAALVSHEVRSTEALLATLQERTSPDVRQAFERDLRSH
ncbi:MAG TPA: M1 family aminopeptidase [Vicinamibacteria bacterium]|nr:M1 family aminopeptidase [Vicinamibacteria bacterium]